MRKSWVSVFIAFFLLASGTAIAAPDDVWVSSWASAQQPADGSNAIPSTHLTDGTVRQFVRLSVPGRGYRLVISNIFGDGPLRLTAVHVAKPGGTPGSIDPKTDQMVTFMGRSEVDVPPGMIAVSDPVSAPVPSLAELAVTIYYYSVPGVQTGHPGSRTTSYLVTGNHVGDAVLAGAQTRERWFMLARVDVLAPQDAGTVVAFGDSIVDGHGATVDGNDRWSDVLASALQGNPATAQLGVVNEGIGGNCVLGPCIGQAAITRFGRDVLENEGVKALVMLEGVNDLGGLSRRTDTSGSDHRALVDNLIWAYRSLAARAKARGVKAYIGTILPFTGNSYYHPDAAIEADRNAINEWIRTQKVFDGVVDFDLVTRDPSHPERLLPAYDCGDALHPSPAGYKVMGEAVAKVIGNSASILPPSP